MVNFIEFCECLQFTENMYNSTHKSQRATQNPNRGRKVTGQVCFHWLGRGPGVPDTFGFRNDSRDQIIPYLWMQKNKLHEKWRSYKKKRRSHKKQGHATKDRISPD